MWCSDQQVGCEALLPYLKSACHRNTLHCVALLCITLPTLPRITLHYLALPCITLHYLALPYITLHYIQGSLHIRYNDTKMIQVCKISIYHHILYNILRWWCQNYRTKLGVQKYGKIPYLRTPPDPDSARIRILFYNSFFCSILSGTLEVTVHIFASFYVSFWDPEEVIYCTYICIILCIFLGYQKKWHRNQNYRRVYAKLIIERKK